MNSNTPQIKSFRSFEARQDGDRQTSRSESYRQTARESSVASATIQADSTARDMSIDLDVSADAAQLKRFVVSIDFGTTFSSISFLILPRNTPPDSLDPHILYHHIQTIDHFPEEPCLGLAESRKEVPTEIWYPKEEYLEDSIMGVGNGSDDFPEGELPFHLQDEDEKNTYWGYEVQSRQRIDTDPNQNRRMGRFKLLLDESELTAQIRLDLEPTLDMMKKRKMIKDREDVISHYLTHLFSHAKEELSEKHGYTNDCPVEFVLCVPPIWTPKACRIMQTNMLRAIQESGFGNSGNCIDNLFIVSEPEAAAAYVIESTTTVLPKEAFVLLDAGGGTVDAITYTVNQTYPLRLEAEGVEAGGALCGSSYLNEAFQEHLSARLKDEDYLERNGISIRSIVDTEVVKFENNIKRKIDIVRPKSVFEFVEIQDLRLDPRKNFGRNRLRLTHNDLRGIFLPVLEKVSGLMERQLELAKMRKINVTKVILIGGFANSPSLRSFLKQKLASLKSYQDEDIPLVFPMSPGPAVASGAILRALNKRDGPRRISRSSYGFRCHESFNPDDIPAHRGIIPYSEPLDGGKYLKNTIEWLIKKGDEIPSYKEFSMKVFYIFDVKRGTRFECEEVLFVSDDVMESHYRERHELNKGAKRAGTIETDMTFLKQRNLIQPVEVEGGVGKRHYHVEFELVMIVIDRNLRWEARYPAGGEVQGRGQVSIASAFLPGTR